MNEFQYKSRLKKIEEDEENGEITSEEAALKKKQLKNSYTGEEGDNNNSRYIPEDESEEVKNDDEEHDNDDEDDDNNRNKDKEDKEEEKNKNEQDSESESNKKESSKNENSNTENDKSSQTNNQDTDADNLTNEIEKNEGKKAQKKDLKEGKTNNNGAQQGKGQQGLNNPSQPGQGGQTPPGVSNPSTGGINAGTNGAQLAGSNAGTAGATGAGSAGATGAGASAGAGAAGAGAAGAGATGAGAAGAGAGAAGAGAGAAGLTVAAPVVAIILLVVVIIIMLVGIIFFFVCMPGTVVGKIGETIISLKEEFINYFNGSKTASHLVTRDDVMDAAKYLEQMGYDLEGYGFLNSEVKDTASAEGNGNIFAHMGEWWNQTDEDDSESLALEDFAKEGDIDNIEEGDEVVTTYHSEEIDWSENPSDRSLRKTILMVKNEADEIMYVKSKYLSMYLTAQNASYLIRNYNTDFGNRLLKRYGINDTSNGSGLIRFWSPTSDENIKLSDYVDNIDGIDGLSFADCESEILKIDRVSISMAAQIMRVKNESDGWFKSTYYIYNLNNVLSYGFPLQLSLALHLSTMAPDFAFAVAQNATTETMVNMALIRTDKNNVVMRIKLDLDNDGVSEYYTVESKVQAHIHKKADNDEDEETYSTWEEAKAHSIELDEEMADETLEDNKELSEKIQTIDEATNELIAEIEQNKISVEFYYETINTTGYNTNRLPSYVQEIQPTNEWNFVDQDSENDKYPAYIINPSDQMFSKIATLLINFELADYVDDENNIVTKDQITDETIICGIKIRTNLSLENQEIVDKIKDAFVENTENMDFSESQSFMNSNINVTNFPVEEDVVYELAKNQDGEYTFDNYPAYDQNFNTMWTFFYDNKGEKVFVNPNQNNIADINAQYIHYYKPNEFFFLPAESGVCYWKATNENIWDWYFNDEQLSVSYAEKNFFEKVMDVLTSFVPLREYYRLKDEDGNIVTDFSVDNSEDFVYANNAKSYYKSSEDGWFWRKAIPKEIADAIARAVWGEKENSTGHANDVYNILKAAEQTNTDNFTRFIPFITSVKGHWYEDLDYSGCYEWVTQDGGIENIYNYKATDADGTAVVDASNNNVLSIKEILAGKLIQIKEPEIVGTPGELIKKLMQDEYYTYDGAGKSEEKRKISFSDMAVDVIAMLEQIQGSYSQNIIRMFKELLAQYNIVFEETADTSLKKELFSSVIETYNGDLITEGDNCMYQAQIGVQQGFQIGLNVVAPIDAKVTYIADDVIALEIIAPNKSYDGYTILITGFAVDREKIFLSNEVHKGDKIGKTIKQNVKFTLRDENGAIVKNSYNMISGTNYENFAKIFVDKSYRLLTGEDSYIYKSKEENLEGFKEGEKVFASITGTITEVTKDSITIKNTEVKQGEAFSGYTVTISGIELSSSISKGQNVVARTTEIGKTTKSNIKIVLKDENETTISGSQGSYDVQKAFDEGIVSSGEQVEINNIDKNHGEVVTQISTYLINKGYDKKSIAAVLGNMFQECRLKPDTNSSPNAFGLLQWTNNSDTSRGQALLNYAQTRGKSWTDVYVQLDFMLQEHSWYIEASYKYPYSAKYTNLLDFLNNNLNLDIDSLTSEFYCCTEDPGLSDPSLQVRKEAAKKCYEMITNSEN